MDRIEKFITVLAWIFGIGSTGLFCLRLLAKMTYTDFDRLRDMVRENKIYMFPLKIPFIIAIICWSWIFTRYWLG